MPRLYIRPGDFDALPVSVVEVIGHQVLKVYRLSISSVIVLRLEILRGTRAEYHGSIIALRFESARGPG